MSASFQVCMHAGISGLISDHPEILSIVDYTDKDEGTKTACNKARKSYKNGSEAGVYPGGCLGCFSTPIREK